VEHIGYDGNDLSSDPDPMTTVHLGLHAGVAAEGYQKLNPTSSGYHRQAPNKKIKIHTSPLLVPNEIL